MPGLSTEIGHSRDLPAAVTALRRGEIDMGCGRVYPAGPQGQGPDARHGSPAWNRSTPS